MNRRDRHASGRGGEAFAHRSGGGTHLLGPRTHRNFAEWRLQQVPRSSDSAASRRVSSSSCSIDTASISRLLGLASACIFCQATTPTLSGGVVWEFAVRWIWSHMLYFLQTFCPAVRHSPRPDLLGLYRVVNNLAQPLLAMHRCKLLKPVSLDKINTA